METDTILLSTEIHVAWSQLSHKLDNGACDYAAASEKTRAMINLTTTQMSILSIFTCSFINWHIY